MPYEWRAFALGAAAGLALGCARFMLNSKLIAGFLKAGGGKIAAAGNSFFGIALTGAFLVFCIKTNMMLFAGAAAGLGIMPFVLLTRAALANR